MRFRFHLINVFNHFLTDGRESSQILNNSISPKQINVGYNKRATIIETRINDLNFDKNRETIMMNKELYQNITTQMMHPQKIMVAPQPH
jgi:hypothetical protein